MIKDDLTKRIIGCAYAVYNTLGFGFLESVYEKSLHHELNKNGLMSECQKPLIVHYDGVVVGEFIADLIVADRIVVKLKSVRKLAATHEAQLVNYLAATGIDVGLLINFSPRGVEVKRKRRNYQDDKSFS